MNKKRLAVSLLALGFGVLTAGGARADDEGGGKAHVALDLDGTSEGGGGGGLRLGYELDAVIMTLIPEIAGTYHSLSDVDFTILRGVAGARLRFLKALEPGVYAHIGGGHIDPSWTAGTADGGLLLDLTVFPVVEVGAHGGYNVQFGTDADDSFDWWTGGLHIALVL